MTDEQLRKMVTNRLIDKGVPQHSQRFIRAMDIVAMMRLPIEQRAKAREIAREWVE